MQKCKYIKKLIECVFKKVVGKQGHHVSCTDSSQLVVYYFSELSWFHTTLTPHHPSSFRLLYKCSPQEIKSLTKTFVSRKKVLRCECN